MKKAISLILSLLMLASMFVTVSATNDIISSEVLNQITDGEDPEVGLGVAFLYTMDMKNTNHHSVRSFVSAYANGEKVVKLGAVVSNQAETGEDADAMVIENANGIKLLNVGASKLWEWDDTYLSYAVRITNIPEANKKTQIYARPYYILEDGTVVYGDITSKSYFSGWCDNQEPVELPAIGTDIDVTKKKNRIRVSAATIVDRTVSLTFKNYSTWITEETDYVRYSCYDVNGNVLDADPNSTAKYGTIYIGCIDTKKNNVKTFTFVVPDETAEVRLTSSKIVYWTEWT